MPSTASGRGLLAILLTAVLAATVTACSPRPPVTGERAEEVPAAAVGPRLEEDPDTATDPDPLTSRWEIDFTADPVQLYLTTHSSASCAISALAVTDIEPGSLRVNVGVQGGKAGMCTPELAPAVSRIAVPRLALAAEHLTVHVFGEAYSVRIPANVSRGIDPSAEPASR